MAKTEKVFEMLRLIKEYPNLTAQDLARLCDVSVRGIYRYLNTLAKAGIPIRFQRGGYKLPESESDLVGRFDLEGLRMLKTLLSIGIRNCDDAEMLRYGKDIIELIDRILPAAKRRELDEIEIVSEGARAVYHGGTITIGHSSKPSIINPILTSDTISVDLMNIIFSSLMKFDSSGRPVPDLAKSWEVSEDGLVWTFLLRDDVTFHDGYPLTARDAEFTYRSILDPKNMSPISERYKLINEVEAEDDYMLRIVLKHPFAPFASRLGRPIAPRHLLGNADLHNAPFNMHPVGSGPFKLTDWTEDDTIVLEANREYFQKQRPVLDRLVFKAYPDRKAALQALSRSEMDMALNLMASDLLFVGKRGSFRVYSAPGAYYALIFDLKNPIFSDIRVREALDYAIDKDSIIKNQLKGHSSICTGPFSVTSWAYNPDVQTNPYDVEKAKELLAQAGWQDTDHDGVLDKDGEPFEIALTVPNITDSLERIAVAIRAQLMKIGVRVKLVYINDSKLYSTPFQTVLAMIAAGAEPDRAYRFWHSEGGDINLASYQNSLVDDLLEQGRQITNLEERRAIYHKIHKMIHDDYPAVFLASGREFVGSNYRFSGASFSSLMHFLTTSKDWQIVGGQKEDADRRLKANTL